ncbi:hypothetical protein [Granulicella paludicola]|uniref:hypothetical protein n=1 Tax=Granulicella paludicola TaxID=474951 RepID=UPI0021DF625E|nr:hypothetical protein [Granulicella paludicola]
MWGRKEQPTIPKHSTDGRDLGLGLVLVVAVNALIFVDPWHYIRTRWPGVQVLETIFVVLVIFILMCMFGAIINALYIGFWPTLYSLVDWHRSRTEKRDLPVARKSHGPATFSSNLKNDLARVARPLLLGALGFSALWGVHAFSKWFFR